MCDRGRATWARVLLTLVVAGVCVGPGFAQGQRKEADAKKVVRNADPSLTPVVSPGTSFTYRVSLKKGYSFDTGHNDGIVASVVRGNVIVGDMRRVSARIFELDLSSENNGVGGSIALRINVTNSKGRLKFVRSAVTFALPGGNELVTVSPDDKTILGRFPVGSRPTGVDAGGLNQQQFTLAFVCNAGSNTVSIVDVPSNTLRMTVGVGSQPSFVSVAGLFGFQTAFVTNAGSDNVTAIDVQTLSVVATIPVGDNPQGIARGGVPNLTERLYVANHDDNTVSVIDAQTRAVVDVVAVGNGPTGDRGQRASGIADRRRDERARQHGHAHRCERRFGAQYGQGRQPARRHNVGRIGAQPLLRREQAIQLRQRHRNTNTHETARIAVGTQPGCRDGRASPRTSKSSTSPTPGTEHSPWSTLFDCARCSRSRSEARLGGSRYRDRSVSRVCS